MCSIIAGRPIDRQTSASSRASPWEADEELFFAGVILNEAGIPGNGRFCCCWGRGTKDLLFASDEF
jgi:hypothetical protein